MATRTIEVSDLVVAIEARIEQLDISYAEAARRLGVSPQRLSQWLRGASVILDSDLQAALARFLHVSPRSVLELMGYSTSGEALRGQRGSSGLESA